MSWQKDALNALKKAGIPVTSSSITDDALIVDTMSADGESYTIVATRGDADGVAEALGYRQEVRYKVQAGYYTNKTYAKAFAQTLTEHGFPAVVKSAGDGGYTVQAGAFSVLNNAKILVGKLKAAGFDAIIKEG